MAEQQKNKPKIDLRARLGKKSAGGPAASIPPAMKTGVSSIPPAQPPISSPMAAPSSPAASSPMASAPTSSIPAAAPPMAKPAPAPGASIPSPPFAQKAAPAVSAFASQPAPAPRVVEPQAIKIEMGEEVMEAQKKGRKKVMMIAAATALVGILLGTQLGGGLERRGRQNLAIDGAKMLTSEIDKANLQINEMAEVLAEAKRELSDGKYPEAAVNKLAETGITFDGTYLYGKGVGLMSPKINKQLVDFAGRAALANEQKETLQLVLSSARKPIEELLSQKDTPKFNWSVYLVNGAHGPMAAMQPVPEPFLVTDKKKKDYKWPESIEIPTGGEKKEKVELYTKGNPISSEPKLIPVDPSSQGAVCPNDTQVRLRQEIVKLETLLKGDKSNPANEVAGLSDLGGSIIDQLKGIGMGG